MAVARTYETFTSRQLFPFRLVDQFAASLRTMGPYPPVVGPVRLFLTKRTDIARIYDPEREIASWMNATGCLVTGGDVLPANSGDPMFKLAAGEYKMRIESDFYLPDEFDVTWPPSATTEVPLLPTPAYPFPELTSNPPGTGVTIARGCLFTRDGQPKAGAPVSVSIQEAGWAIPGGWPFAEAKTGAKGEWVLILPDEAEMIDPLPNPLATTIQVRYALDGDVFDRTAAAGRENRVLQASVRGTAADGRGRPLAGVQVTNSLQSGTSVTDRDGHWSIFFPVDQPDADGTATATAPNGNILNRLIKVIAHKAVNVERFQFS